MEMESRVQILDKPVCILLYLIPLGKAYILFNNLFAWAGYDTRSIFFKQSLTGLNSEFSFS